MPRMSNDNQVECLALKFEEAWLWWAKRRRLKRAGHLSRTKAWTQGWWDDTSQGAIIQTTPMNENTRSNNVKCLHHRYKAAEEGLLSSWKLFWQSIELSMTVHLFAGSHWWVGIDIEYMFGLDILFCLLNIITIFFYVMPHDSITICIAHCPVYLTCYMSILLVSFCVS